MRRPFIARRIVAFALASGAIALAGCPAAPDRPANVSAPETETETVEVVANDATDVSGPDRSFAETDAAADSAGVASPGVAPSGGAAAEIAPAITLELPNDFLRPTPSDVPLRNEEPVAPLPGVTDFSAEAADPNSLPGGTPIGDLFEGLQGEPIGDPNE